jgi:D-glycero-D-manno-heptose 1,7-bisphosphate phosphatase
MKDISLVILAGGKGKRIKKYSKGCPKPLLKFNGITFLNLIINNFSKYNFNKIYILCGYRGHLFKKYNGKFYNSIRVEVIREKSPLGTGGCLFALKKKIKNDFILVNGDTFCGVNIKKFIDSKPKKTSIHLALVKNKTYLTNNQLVNLNIDKNKTVLTKGKSKLMSAGIIFFKRKILMQLRKNFFSLEHFLIPQYISKKLVSGLIVKNFFLDIGTPKNYLFAVKNIKNILFKKAIFLDRDGVINKDTGYVSKFKNFIFKKGVLDGLKYLVKKNYYVFIVTNQAGIAKKKFSIDDYIKLNYNLKFYLAKRNIYFNEVKFCPHHPKGLDARYRSNCSCRKPRNKMLKEIFNEWFIDKKASFMIGDKNKDRLAAKKSRIKFFYAQDNLYKQLKKICT